MTTDTKSMLDIVLRIATRLKEEERPERRVVGEQPAERIRANGQRPSGQVAGGTNAGKGNNRAGTTSAAGESNPTGTTSPAGASKHGKGERGFTIAEMLISMVLVAGSAALIATAIYQVFIVAKDGNARLSVLGDVQNASIWVGRDSSEAASWSAGSGTVYGTLTTGDPTVEYRYSYDAANTSLVREHLVSGSPVSTLSIARRIANQGDVSFSLSGSLLTFSITGTSGSTSESATLKLGMRVK